VHEDSSYGAGGPYNPQQQQQASSGDPGRHEDEHQLLHGAADPAGRDTETETGYGRHPGRPWGDSAYGRPGREEDEEDEDDVAYHGAAAPPYTAPSALSPTDYAPVGGRTSFPAAPYGYNRGVPEER
jgi:hypothetical protein